MSIGSLYRQGDVLLVPVAALPRRTHPQDGPEGRHVLALGEATGHSHTMGADRVRCFREDGTGRAFVEVPGPDHAELVLQELDPVRFEPGLYEVRLHREYRPERDPYHVMD